MIGTLVDAAGNPVAVLSDRGDWEAPPGSPEPLADVAASLNRMYHPVRNATPGDHHRAFGLDALSRAAIELGLTAVPAVPDEPPPPGVVY